MLPPPHNAAEAISRLKKVDAWFGHGRALEGILILVKYTYFIMFLFTPKDRIAMISLGDVEWIPGYILALPFFVAATLSAIGLTLNALSFELCRYFRIWGATVGMMIWIFILIGNHRHGYVLAGLSPWCFWVGIFGSIWIIRRGYKGLPRPGATGEV